MVIPVKPDLCDYAESVRDTFAGAGFWADADLGKERMPKKIRNAVVAQYNYILVVGDKGMHNCFYVFICIYVCAYMYAFFITYCVCFDVCVCFDRKRT